MNALGAEHVMGLLNKAQAAKAAASAEANGEPPKSPLSPLPSGSKGGFAQASVYSPRAPPLDYEVHFFYSL